MPIEAPAESSNYVQLVSQVLIGGGVVAFILKRIEEYIQTRRTEKAQQAIVAAADIYDSLNTLKDHIKCDRISVNYTSNGGGIPEPGKAIYYTMLYDVHNSGGDSNVLVRRSDLQNILVDEAYVYLLRDLIVQGYVDANPADFKEGMFRQQCELENVTHVYILPIYKTELRFYYLTIQWNSDTPRLSDTTIDYYSDIAVKTISNVLKKSK